MIARSLALGGVTGLYYESADFAVATGDRAFSTQEPLPGARHADDPRLGRVVASIRGGGHNPKEARRWELEIVLDRRRPSTPALAAAVGYAVQHQEVADAIVQLYRRGIPGEGAARFRALPPALARLGARQLDLRAASVWVDRGFHYALRTLRVVWTHEWMVAVWGPPGPLTDGPYPAACRWPLRSIEARSASLPARRPYHLTASTPTAVGGEDALVRLGYWIAGHHAYSVAMISETLERWQSQFFERSASRTSDPLTMTRPLSEAGRAIVLVRPALRLGSPVKSSALGTFADLMESFDETAAALRRTTADLRDSYALASEHAALFEAVRAEDKATADRRVQRTASVLAAFVLWPGLVAAIYSADVDGLPGKGDQAGLWYLVGASAVGALLTLLALLVLLRDRSQP